MREKEKLMEYVKNGKVPYWIKEHGGRRTTITLVLDKEGLHTIIMRKDGFFSHGLKPLEEVTDEDCLMLYEKCVGV